MYDVLHTLIFVVTDKLGAGEPDLLWHTRGTRIFSVSTRQETEEPDRNMVSERKTTTRAKDLLDFSPFFKGNDDEVSVQSKNTEGQETLDKLM